MSTAKSGDEVIELDVLIAGPLEDTVLEVAAIGNGGKPGAAPPRGWSSLATATNAITAVIAGLRSWCVPRATTADAAGTPCRG